MTDGANGCFALVTYLPEPLTAALQEMRATLPGEVHSRPHVTVLPPRPLVRPIVEISPAIEEIINGTVPFTVELGQVCLFADTSVLYLSIGQGYREIEDLHEAIAKRQDDGFCEEHDFRPHLTLAGPLPENQLSAAQRDAEMAWANIRANSRFRVERIELLQLPPAGQRADWKQVWSRSLGLPEFAKRSQIELNCSK